MSDTMKNARIIKLKKQLRFSFNIDYVLETFGEEVWENNNYGEEFGIVLSKGKFIKYFKEAMLNPGFEFYDDDDEDVVKWSPDQFGGDKCGFCNEPNKGLWIEGDEDAVCEKCSQVWEYDDDTDSYRQLQPSRRA